MVYSDITKSYKFTFDRPPIPCIGCVAIVDQIKENVENMETDSYIRLECDNEVPFLSAPKSA